MKLYLVKDKEAKSDFGYQEIKHYQIFVKESVYKQMLKSEMRNPNNWGRFLYSLFILFSNIFIKAFIVSISITFLYFISCLSQGMALQELAIDTLGFIKLLFVIFVLLWFIMRANYCKYHSLSPLYLAKNNVFSQAIFHKLSQRANELEATKNEKN